MLLASKAEDPGQGSAYWFCMAALGGSGNEASGGEMEYDGRVAGIGVSAGKEGDMGRSGQIGGGVKRGVLMWFSWWCAQMATYFALAGEAR
jgi:hypothetical protein